jgi:pyruvate kinase
VKILPTIGPASQKVDDLKFIFKYCDTVRLNASHNNLRWHKKIIRLIKKIDKNINILIDFPGVKPRTNNDKDIEVKKGQLISFSHKFSSSSKNLINLTRPLPLPIKENSNSFFSLDDGKIIFRKIKFNKDILIGKSTSHCLIQRKKGLNIPGSIYNNNQQKNIYIDFFKRFSKLPINAVGLSFVQNKDLIIFLKKKYPQIILISKIENSEGLKNSDEICKFSDGIMIDRGDLSAEIGDHNLYDAIIEISNNAKKYGKPLIMATENLETLSTRNNPSRNDIISLGVSRQINSDIIMLSEETAISNKWKKILVWLNKFLNKKISKKIKLLNRDIFWNTVENIKDFPLVIFTKRGLMLNNIFKKNLDNNVFIFTDTQRTKALSNFYNNAKCFITTKFDNKNINKFYYSYLRRYKNIIFKKSNLVFLITIAFPKKGSLANTLSLLKKNEI